ncbi:hypothetical protein [Bacillus cereus]|uniref:Phage protein n=1 Tax=Bacillus cereus TaxID=1396 RepID=A0ABD4LLN1_BACCE|nr:hypothetical protein [Bacillus cereus]MBK1611704.1 hypothetical protein [Bacillus cereus]
MGLTIRESDEIRKIKSLDGDYYYLQKSAVGFGQEYIFYNEEGEEIETFSPSMSDYFDVDGFYDFEEAEKVLFEGMIIRAEFSYSEFYE